MENTIKPLSLVRRILYFVIAVMLAVSSLSVINRTATEKTSERVALDLEYASIAGGEYSSGAIVATDEEGCVITVQLSGKLGGTVRFFGTGLSTDALECTYVTANDDDLEAKGMVLSDGSLEFRLYSPTDSTLTLWLAKGATVSGISYTPSHGYDFGYEFNIRAFVILAVALILLVAFDKKIGFIFNTGAAIKRILADARQTLADSGRLKLAVWIITTMSLIVYIIAAAVDFVFVVIAPRYAVALAVLALFACASAIARECMFKESVSISRLFITLALIIGSFIALSQPISTQVAWDDGYHFANSAYVPAIITEWRLPESVSMLARERFLNAVYTSDQQSVLGVILSEYHDTAPFAFSFSSLFEGFKWYYAFGILILPLVLLYFIFDYIAYIPAWIFLTLMGACGADAAKLLVFGRLVNLAVYALLIFFAIRKLKSGKYIFAAVGLLPVFLFLGASYSTDWWINGAMMLGLAYLIGALQGGEVFTRRELSVIIGFMAFATGPKQIYFFMMSPILFLPRSKFKSRRSARRTKILVAVLMLAILLTFAVPMLMNPDSRTDSRGGSDVSSSGQISYILHNPFEYAGTLLNYMQSYLSVGFGAEHLTLFAWLDSGYAVFSLLAVMVLLFVTFTDRSGKDLFRGAGMFRAINLFTSFCTVVLVVTSLFVAFTPVGSKWVNGCQYRYIFPILPITLWCLGSHRVRCEMSERAKAITVFSVSTVAAIGSFITALLV